jgi:DNA-binding MarR family transcriptional regulator
VQRAYRALDTAIGTAVRERGFDVGLPHSAVLANIDIETGTRATTLAERAGVSKQAIGELINDLEGNGYVERHTDPTDGRAKLVRLTPAGHRLIQAALEVIDGLEAKLEASVGERALRQTRRTLEAVIDTVEDDIT